MLRIIVVARDVQLTERHQQLRVIGAPFLDLVPLPVDGPDVPFRIDADAVRVGRAVLSVMPLDGFVDAPVRRMEADGRKELNDAHRDFAAMVEGVAGSWVMGSIERFRFYEEARGCVAVFATQEMRPYANFILTKGVIAPDGSVVRPERPVRRPKGLRP